jgi:hypothetical protein
MKTDPSLTPALTIIKETDPRLYAEMQASPWEAHVAVTGDEPAINDLMAEYGPEQGAYFLYILEHAYGATVDNKSFLNPGMIKNQARVLHVPVDDFTADVLVHEYTHASSYPAPNLDERHAFAAGTRFAKKLPAAWAGPIARYSEQGTKQVLAGKY